MKPAQMHFEKSHTKENTLLYSQIIDRKTQTRTKKMNKKERSSELKGGLKKGLSARDQKGSSIKEKFLGNTNEEKKKD